MPHKCGLTGWVKTGRLQENNTIVFLELNDGSCASNFQVSIMKPRTKRRAVAASPFLLRVTFDRLAGAGEEGDVRYQRHQGHRNLRGRHRDHRGSPQARRRRRNARYGDTGCVPSRTVVCRLTNNPCGRPFLSMVLATQPNTPSPRVATRSSSFARSPTCVRVRTSSPQWRGSGTPSPSRPTGNAIRLQIFDFLKY